MTKDQLRIVYMATADFALPSLKALVEGGYNVVAVVTMPDKPMGRGHKLKESNIKTYAVSQGLEVLQPVRLRDEEFVARLQELQPDLGIVVAFRMLPEVVWMLPRLGTINLHGSLLPRYRGAAPIHWAIMNGDTETGVTTFRLRHELDTGDVLLQDRLPSAPDDNVGRVHDRLMLLGAKTLLRTVDLFLQEEEPKGRAQEDYEEAPTPAPKLTKENTELLWNRPTEVLHNQVRGLAPYPAAWATLAIEGHEPLVFKILETEPILSSDDLTSHPEPGTILIRPKGQLWVATADGFLAIKTLQPPAKKAMSASAYLNGLR